jgi:hypothetical protein
MLLLAKQSNEPSKLKSMAAIGMVAISVLLTYWYFALLSSQVKYFAVLSAEQLANIKSYGLNSTSMMGAECYAYVLNTFP